MPPFRHRVLQFLVSYAIAATDTATDTLFAHLTRPPLVYLL